MDEKNFLKQFIATASSFDNAYASVKSHIGSTDELDDHFAIYSGDNFVAVDFMWNYESGHTRVKMGAIIHVHSAHNTDWSNFDLHTDSDDAVLIETHVFSPPQEIVRDYGISCLEQFVKEYTFDLSMKLSCPE